MDRKRRAEVAGIKIHVKKGEEDMPDEDDVDQTEQEKSTQQQTAPLQKRKAGRPWRSSTGGEDGGEGSKNLFAGIGSKFGVASQPNFSAGAFGGAPSGSSLFGSTTAPPTSATTNAPLFAAAPTVSANIISTAAPSGIVTPQAFTTIPVSSSSATSSKSNDNESHYRNMIALNTSFLNWIQSRVKESPDASLVSGVKSYIEYSTKIENGNTSSEQQSSQSVIAPTKPSETISQKNTGIFGNSGTGSTSNSSTGSTALFGSSSSGPASSSSLFGGSGPTLFGNAASSSASGGVPSLFASTTTPSASLFAGSTLPGSSTSLFGNATGSQSLFGSTSGSVSLFGTAKPIAPTSGGGGDDDGEDGEGDDEPETSEPSKQALKQQSKDEEVLFEIEPCKVLAMKDGSWASRGGKGRLEISKHKETGKCRAVLRAGVTGNLYFNAPINSSMQKMLSKQKNTVKFVTSALVPNGSGEMEPDNGGKPTMYALKVSTEEDAERLRSALEKAMST